MKRTRKVRSAHLNRSSVGVRRHRSSGPTCVLFPLFPKLTQTVRHIEAKTRKQSAILALRHLHQAPSDVFSLLPQDNSVASTPKYSSFPSPSASPSTGVDPLLVMSVWSQLSKEYFLFYSFHPASSLIPSHRQSRIHNAYLLRSRMRYSYLIS